MQWLLHKNARISGQGCGYVEHDYKLQQKLTMLWICFG